MVEGRKQNKNFTYNFPKSLDLHVTEKLPVCQFFGDI